MKKILYDYLGRFIFKSKHKTFDKKANATTGIKAGFLSTESIYICRAVRSYDTTVTFTAENERQREAEGVLQDYDINLIRNFLNPSVIDQIKTSGHARYLLIYNFYYWGWRQSVKYMMRGEGPKRVDIGWILTDWYSNKYVAMIYARPNKRTISALDECKKYVCNEDYSEETMKICKKCKKRFMSLTNPTNECQRFEPQQ